MKTIEDIRNIEKATEVRFHLGGPFYIDGRECFSPTILRFHAHSIILALKAS